MDMNVIGGKKNISLDNSIGCVFRYFGIPCVCVCLTFEQRICLFKMRMGENWAWKILHRIYSVFITNNVELVN